jgi:sec-independent protein translocase protein TatB
MLQTGEIIVILLLALVVLGPKRLPDLARKMGRWTTELRTAAKEITRGLQAEVDDIKAVGRELKAPMDEVKKPFTEIRDEMSGFGAEGREWKGPKPVSGPTPEDAMRDLEEMNRMAEEEGASPDDPATGDDEPSPAEETGDAADERSE